MPRAADYTIQSFLYQFNKTALEILKAQDDDNITVEGIVVGRLGTSIRI